VPSPLPFPFYFIQGFAFSGGADNPFKEVRVKLACKLGAIGKPRFVLVAFIHEFASVNIADRSLDAQRRAFQIEVEMELVPDAKGLFSLPFKTTEGWRDFDRLNVDRSKDGPILLLDQQLFQIA
jgi:hypothetical protein